MTTQPILEGARDADIYRLAAMCTKPGAIMAMELIPASALFAAIARPSHTHSHTPTTEQAGI